MKPTVFMFAFLPPAHPSEKTLETPSAITPPRHPNKRAKPVPRPKRPQPAGSAFPPLPPPEDPPRFQQSQGRLSSGVTGNRARAELCTGCEGIQVSSRILNEKSPTLPQPPGSRMAALASGIPQGPVTPREAQQPRAPPWCRCPEPGSGATSPRQRRCGNPSRTRPRPRTRSLSPASPRSAADTKRKRLQMKRRADTFLPSLTGARHPRPSETAGRDTGGGGVLQRNPPQKGHIPQTPKPDQLETSPARPARHKRTNVSASLSDPLGKGN